MIRYFWPSDDEQLAGQWLDSHMAEDADWWVGVQKAGATLALAGALLLSAASTAAATSVFSQPQDDPALFVQVLASEEYWQNPVPPIVWPQPSVITDDDIHVQFVQTFTPDDGDWTPLVPPVQATNYVFLPFLELDQTPQFTAAVPVVDDSSVWAPNIPPADPDWNVLFFLDDGSWVPAMEPDEDFLPTGALPAPWNWPQPLQPFAVPDDITPEFPANDDFWPQYVQPVPASLLWPQQFLFEQNESTNLVAFTAEEHSWPIPVPVPASMWVLRQDGFEQHDATGSLTLILDDGFQSGWQPFVPLPDPGSLRLLQQWPFEQNEPAGSLRNNVDELYWQNWVPPVFGYPVPVFYTGIINGSADEIIVQQSAATIDELYASGQFMAPTVPPVPASMLLVFPYQPDPEEIPAGSLVPFIPPPPAFCPLPPAGPDKDISMSIFKTSGGGPVLALFCRICNSGNPLVVRADYAIWCQDCCAFVSKQDTYMGTVRAPGQFRGRF